MQPFTKSDSIWINLHSDNNSRHRQFRFNINLPRHIPRRSEITLSPVSLILSSIQSSIFVNNLPQISIRITNTNSRQILVQIVKRSAEIIFENKSTPKKQIKTKLSKLNLISIVVFSSSLSQTDLRDKTIQFYRTRLKRVLECIECYQQIVRLNSCPFSKKWFMTTAEFQKIINKIEKFKANLFKDFQ